MLPDYRHTDKHLTVEMETLCTKFHADMGRQTDKQTDIQTDGRMLPSEMLCGQ